ncbi:MAG: hypothetical protein PHD76_04695 [Methylacidiphilales bacterium]|nr:hypothetical protein [Candidatus Methylacidiphilales bacterium]
MASAFVLILLLLLVVPQSRFNWWYHNDEPSKVMQVMGGMRNLRHPPLMLSVVSFFSPGKGNGDEQKVVECGRLFSTLCAGVALVALVWMAALRAGSFAGAGAGLLLLFQPWFFEAAHYFKEDTLFLAGVVLTFTGMMLCEQNDNLPKRLFLAFALALCVSGKYAGWLAAPFAGFYLLRPARKGGYAAALAGALFFAGLVLWWNWPLLADWNTFREAASDEGYRLIKGEYGLLVVSPAADYLRLLREQIPAVLGVGFVIYGGTCIWNFKKTRPVEWCLLALPFFYFGIVALSAKYSDRYLFPVFLLVCAAGYYGPVLILRRIWPGRAGCAAVLLLWSVALADSYSRWLPVYLGFKSDSRGQLAEYIRTRLPSDAVIAQDLNVSLNPAITGGRRIEEDVFVADIGSVAELRALGVTHVAVSYEAYHRFVDGWISPVPAQRGQFDRRAAFYRLILKNKAAICWDRPNQVPKALHPGLTLVDIEKVE